MHGRFSINGGQVPGLPRKSTPMHTVLGIANTGIFISRQLHSLLCSTSHYSHHKMCSSVVRQPQHSKKVQKYSPTSNITQLALVSEGLAQGPHIIHSFMPDISIELLQVHCYSEALPTTALILCRS